MLVNAKTQERPAKADVLAQANLDRGGNVDEPRRAKTPLPVTEPRTRRKGPRRRPAPRASSSRRSSSACSRRRTKPSAASRTSRRKARPRRKPADCRAGRDLADLSLAAMRLQAQIDRQIDDYQKRPRKKFIGANAREYRFAQYEEDWRVKVERVGTRELPGRGARQATTATCASR